MNLLYHLELLAAKINPNDIKGMPKVDASEASIATIMNTVYLWAGIIAVLTIVIGGLLYILSNGDANNIQRAKNTILYSVIGLAVIIFAFTITQLVLFFVT